MDEYQDPRERIHELWVKAREAVDGRSQCSEMGGRGPRPASGREAEVRAAHSAERPLGLEPDARGDGGSRAQAAHHGGAEAHPRGGYASNPTRPGHIRVSSEPLTYKPGGDFSFFKDVVAAERAWTTGLGSA
jgi:hypothetical protein